MSVQLQVLLFGGSDSFSDDKVMQITIAFNHFGKGLVQRMPRVRFGFVHIVNNDYTHWLMYAIGGSQHPTILSQGNRFIAPPDINCKQVYIRNTNTKCIKSFIKILALMFFNTRGMCVRLMIINFFFLVTGDKEGLCTRECVEDMGLEIAR